MSYISDKLRARAAVTIINSLVALAGFATYLGTSPEPGYNIM